MSETKDVLILAIESSCDETAAAIEKTEEKCCQTLFHRRLNCINYMEELCLKLHRESILRKLIR